MSSEEHSSTTTATTTPHDDAPQAPQSPQAQERPAPTPHDAQKAVAAGEAAREGGKEKGATTVLYCAFNQDAQCFVCGTTTGFVVYNCDPFQEMFRRDFDGEHKTGLCIVEMLFKSNILAFVGNDTNPEYPSTKLVIWDDVKGLSIGKLLVPSPIKSVKLRRNRVVVASVQRVAVYVTDDLTPVVKLYTCQNPLGLLALSADGNSDVLACPDVHTGHVQVELFSLGKQTHIAAHDNPLSCLALNVDGSLLVTASQQGTLLRVYETRRGQQLHEFRRGAHVAEVYCLRFNLASTTLCCSSDHGTVHLFALSGHHEEARGADSVPPSPPANTVSSLSYFKNFLPKYFSSEWSFTSFPVSTGARTLVAFSVSASSVFVLSFDGTFMKANLINEDPLRWEFPPENTHNFAYSTTTTTESS